MDAARSAIPVLRFHAGPLHLAIAAEDVKSVQSARRDVLHIARILGVEPSYTESDWRVVRVAVPALAEGSGGSDGSRDLIFQVDAPVGVVRCNAEDLLPAVPSMPADRWKPILGFASIDGQTLLLLDISSVAEKLREYTERGQP